MKKALVTGASRGIGAAIAKRLSSDGYYVYVNYMKSAELANELAAEIGGTAICADVSNLQQVSHMFDEIGDINVLVCNAGISEYGLFTDLSPDDWQHLFNININGMSNCIRSAVPSMIHNKCGCIITLSSVWGIHGASCEVAYSASKAAVIGLTKSLSKELGPSSIRVNCIAPGVIDTDMMKLFSEEDKAELIDATPLCRLGNPSDVANLASFLASDEASFITGQIIEVGGGFGD